MYWLAFRSTVQEEDEFLYFIHFTITLPCVRGFVVGERLYIVRVMFYLKKSLETQTSPPRGNKSARALQCAEGSYLSAQHLHFILDAAVEEILRNSRKVLLPKYM